ncbi:MAG: hypothetical protein WAM88_01070 [Nitrososphaeraceae archaeon]
MRPKEIYESLKGIDQQSVAFDPHVKIAHTAGHFVTNYGKPMMAARLGVLRRVNFSI